MPESWVTTLFARFQGIWLDAFSKNFPNEEVLKLAKQDWREALTGIDPKHISKAIAEARNTLKWPPSIAEFLELCRKARSSDESSFVVAIEHKPESTPESKAKAMKAVSQIKEMLKYGRTCP